MADDPRTDAARLFRAARRSRRLSQREFAGYAGVPNSTIARIESSASEPRYSTVVRALKGVGYDVTFSDQWNRLLVVDDGKDRLVDRGMRQFPAHLPNEPTPRAHTLGNPWWGWYRIAWWPRDPAVPSHTFWRRPAAWWFETVHLGAPPGEYGRVWDDAT